MNQTGSFTGTTILSVVILRNLFELDNTVRPCSTMNAVVIWTKVIWTRLSLTSSAHRGSNSTAPQNTKYYFYFSRESLFHTRRRNIDYWPICRQIFTPIVYQCFLIGKHCPGCSSFQDIQLEGDNFWNLREKVRKEAGWNDPWGRSR